MIRRRRSTSSLSGRLGIGFRYEARVTVARFPYLPDTRAPRCWRSRRRRRGRRRPWPFRLHYQPLPNANPVTRQVVPCLDLIDRRIETRGDIRECIPAADHVIDRLVDDRSDRRPDPSLADRLHPQGIEAPADVRYEIVERTLITR